MEQFNNLEWNNLLMNELGFARNFYCFFDESLQYKISHRQVGN